MTTYRSTASFLLICLLGGCLYEPAYDLSCESEGAREGTRVCRNGIWITDADAGPDNDGNAMADGSIPAPDMGDVGGADVECTAETNVDFCGRLGLDCGEVTAPDNCGDERTLNCGMCTEPQTCGAAIPNVCGCVGEDDPTFCARLVKTCDTVTAPDNCGVERTADCGTCTAPAVCGGGGTPSVCACPDQTDAAFCASYGAVCGALTALDECGQQRTTDCGTCTSPETCGSVAANQCGCPADADVCTALSLECGVADVTGMCTNKTSVNCGGCQMDATCDASNACVCNMGYAPDGLGNCEDIDECATNTDNCAANATCANARGSFTCTCNMGYMGNGVTCADIDECATNTDMCDVNATCTNQPGTHLCMCNSGFTGNGRMCTDVDECASGTDNCDANATCTNQPGTFTCMCNAGYSGSGTTCADIDECATNTDNCDANATCTNQPGSFMCMCNIGYSGDGVTCVPNPLVVSVQSVTLTVGSGQTSASVNLPTAVIAANAVPFITTRVGASEIDDTAIDVVITNTQVQALRAQGGGTVVVRVAVVEFDPTRVRVQTGAFTSEGNVTLTQVNRAASFMTFAAHIDFNNDNVDDRMLSGGLTNDTTLAIGRASTNGSISGHYWVAEALDGSFAVQHLTGSIADGDDTTSLTMASVNPATSFVIYSNRATETDTDLDDGVVSCAITSATNVDCTRRGSSQEISNLHVQVVSVPGITVQRGSTSFAGPGDSQNTTITAVTLADSMVNLGQTGTNGACATNETSNNGWPTAAIFAALTSTTQLQLTRGSAGDGDADCTWEVIEWP